MFQVDKEATCSLFITPVGICAECYDVIYTQVCQLCLMLYIVSLQQVDHVVINTLSLESLNQTLMYHLNYNAIKLSFKFLLFAVRRLRGSMTDEIEKLRYLLYLVHNLHSNNSFE